jgi:PAS domain S-box-containing protein
MRTSEKTKEQIMRELSRVKRKAAQLEQLELERKRVSEALRQSENMFRKITEKSMVGVYLIQDDLFRYVNPKMAGIFGYQVHEMVNNFGPEHVVLAEDWPMVKENLRKRLAGEMESINYSFRGVKLSGDLVHIEVYGSGTDYRGRPAVIGTIVDTTSKVEVQRDLQMQLHRFQALYHIAMAMAAEHSLEENLALLVSSCRELLKTDVSLIAVSDRHSEKMTVRAQSGFRRKDMSDLPIDFLRKQCTGNLPGGADVDAKKCFRQLQSLAKKEFMDENLSTGMAIPLRARKTAIGVLCVASRSHRDYSESEKDVLCLMGNVAALEITRKQAEESLAESENELRHLSAQLLRAQEDERKRLAQELHDGIGQSISAIKFKLETCMKQIRESPDSGAIEQLEMLLPMVQSTVEEIQRIAVDLRPSIIDDLGLVATLRWFLRQFKNTYSDIRLDNRIGLEEGEIPDSLKIVIFRITQEALNNVARHSKAKRVLVALKKRQNSVELLIKDDGRGMMIAHSPAPSNLIKGFGLSSMKERAELSGGTFRLDSGPNMGTSIRASWPITASLQCR